MASQIQNPFNGGAALAGMTNLARVNPLEATGNSMQALAQMQERFKLADLMGQNGGNVTQEMAPIAMLADQQGRDMFSGQQDLQRTDRNLDLTEQNNLWGHQDRQAATGASIANSRRAAGTAANRLAFDRTGRDNLFEGYNQVQDHLSNVNADPMVGPLPQGVPDAQRPMVADPMYPARDGQQTSKGLAALLADQYKSQQTHTNKLEQTAATNTAKTGMDALTNAGKAYEAKQKLLWEKEVDPNKKVAMQNNVINTLAGMGVPPTMDYSGIVSSDMKIEAATKINQDKALAGAQNTNARNERAVVQAIEDKFKFSETDHAKIADGSFVYDNVPREEKKATSAAVMKAAEDAGYDYSAWSGLPFHNDKKKRELIDRSIADVVDPNELPQIEDGNMETVKDVFARAGVILKDESTFGSNFELTPLMKGTLEAKEVVDTMEAEVRAARGAKRERLKAELAQDEKYQAAKAAVRASEYTDSNMDLAKSLK